MVIQLSRELFLVRPVGEIFVNQFSSVDLEPPPELLDRYAIFGLLVIAPVGSFLTNLLTTNGDSL